MCTWKKVCFVQSCGEGRFYDNFGKGSAREFSATKPGRLVLCSLVFRLVVCMIYMFSNFKREKIVYNRASRCVISD